MNFRIGVNGADVVVRELDPATNEYREVAKFDPVAEATPEGISERTGDPDVRYRVTLAEGATSWQVVEGLKSAEFLSGEAVEVPAEGPARAR